MISAEKFVRDFIKDNGTKVSLFTIIRIVRKRDSEISSDIAKVIIYHINNKILSEYGRTLTSFEEKEIKAIITDVGINAKIFERSKDDSI